MDPEQQTIRYQDERNQQSSDFESQYTSFPSIEPEPEEGEDSNPPQGANDSRDGWFRWVSCKFNPGKAK